MERFNNETIKQLKAVLENNNENIVLVPHVNADGDATGSVFGLWNALTNKGLSVKVVSPNSYATCYNWMNGHQGTIVFSKKEKEATEILDAATTLICCDFNHPSRAGNMEKPVENFAGTKVMIDHHPNPSDFCDITISDPSRSSTAELVFALLEELNYMEYVDQNVASSLFAGIMTDTGSFNYNVSDPATFETVSKLLGYGINQDEIHSYIYDNFSANRMRLLGHCLEHMKVFPEYHAAYMFISKKDKKQFHFQKGDSEGFVNYPLSIKGISFSAFFTENDDHIKVSFRSKGTFPVNLFSEENYNGGGHLNAAGGEVYISFEDAMIKFEELLPKYEEQLKKSEK